MPTRKDKWDEEYDELLKKMGTVQSRDVSDDDRKKKPSVSGKRGPNMNGKRIFPSGLILQTPGNRLNFLISTTEYKSHT